MVLCALLAVIPAVNALDGDEVIVVIMARGSPALTKDEVADVYVGRSKALRPIDLPESDSIRALFYKKATDRALAQIRTVWARLTFTGEGRPPIEMTDDLAVKKAVANDRRAIGYISKANVDSSVQVVLQLN